MINAMLNLDSLRLFKIDRVWAFPVMATETCWMARAVCFPMVHMQTPTAWHGQYPEAEEYMWAVYCQLVGPDIETFVPNTERPSEPVGRKTLLQGTGQSPAEDIVLRVAFGGLMLALASASKPVFGQRDGRMPEMGKLLFFHASNLPISGVFQR